MDVKKYNALVVVTPQDFERTVFGRKRLLENLPANKVFFVGSKALGELVEKEGLGDKAGFINEDDLISFEEVYAIVEDIVKEILAGRKLPRGIVGWYYQQFLKMEYANRCEDEYYFMWDGDTVPCKGFSIFADDGVTPFLDVKQEYHEEYFTTLSKILPGAKKVIAPSFISEHMLMKTDLMKKLIKTIEGNPELPGTKFYEKILRSIPASKIQDAAFSEFETYGTFVAITNPNAYRLREWHSFRLGAEFFHPEQMTDRDYKWLSESFDAISFEKNQTVREDHDNLFNNPKYQEKLSARQMLQIAQEEFTDGYKEEWNAFSGDADKDRENVLAAYEPGQNEDWEGMFAALKKGLSDNINNYELYVLLGEYYLLKEDNPDKTFLCYEYAEFICTDANDKKQIGQMKENLISQYEINVRPLSFVIVSWNNKDIMEDCIRSIRRTVPESGREIVVVDNASTDGITSWLEGQLDIKLIKNTENLGFGAGSNIGLEKANPENDIIFLNNDTIVTPGSMFWIRMALYDRTLSDEGKVVAGCCTNYEGSGQPPLKTFDTLKEYLLFANENNVLMDEPYEERAWLSGFALAFRRCVIDKTGGFDPIFGMGYFEDNDLCQRAKIEGAKPVMCRNSYIYHYGSKSFGLQYEKAQELVMENHRKFVAKWGFDPYSE
ncbi:MAG: glycosyltransferase family 2 protein [Lachnospiraceae bacterium]|nr:glycosyltransferase family 2 protein [Lachnospiraceae bacterium]